MLGDGQWSNLRSALVGAVVAAVVLLSFPAIAAVGGNLILGQSNTADAVTSLSGSSAANLRITNSQAGSPALDLRVASGAAPLKVNSTVRVANLNADRLDGKHATSFLLVTGTAANASLLGGRAPGAYAGAPCAPGASLVGYGRSGPICSQPFGSITLDSAGDVGQFTSVVLDAAGFPVISYYDATNGDLKLYRCGNAACTAANTITTVDSAGNVGWFTSLALDASGFPVIAYYDATNLDLKLAHCGNAACTAANSIVTVDSAGNVGQYTSLALDASGLPVISYYAFADGYLKLAHCGDASCTAGNTITTVDSAGIVGMSTSLALDASGFPVISYWDATNGDLKLAHCGNAGCNAGNTITTVDSVGNVGGFTSLALDGSGYPVIAYHDATNGDLKLVRCGNAACAASNSITTVDRAADVVGCFPSLVLDASGYPVIAYYGLTSGDLKLAHCGNAGCNAGNTITTVDSVGDTGSHPSLALDASGHPIISYYNSTNWDLKLAGVTG